MGRNFSVSWKALLTFRLRRSLRPTDKMDMTRAEAFLIRDAMFEFATNRSEGLDWDSGCDPVLVAQINKVLEKVE